MKKINYNPDILNCLANLSNDEVFTPPNVVSDMLDLLPKDLWTNPKATFLDPFTKSGVFLREITKRLNEGLKPLFPDTQERINHILSKQVFGIAITELTSLLSRRSVYCCKTANSDKSIATCFSNEQGNIIYKRVKHNFINGKCEFCGANQDTYSNDEDKENYAYQFIHTYDPKKFFKDMKFDVIIGNPPYQLNDGGGTGSSATPLYHKFVEQAKKLQPRYLCMIIPARWYAGGKGLDEFRNKMLNDNRLRIIHDYNDASECFSGVEIKGGVCYFLWERDNAGLCGVYQHSNNKIVSSMERPLLEKGCDVFIRHNQAISILRKVQNKKEKSFSDIVSFRNPFGIVSDFKEFTEKEFENSVKIYANQKQGYVDKKHITKSIDLINQYKIIVPKAIGIGDMSKDWIKPIIIGKNSCCTETYLVIGPLESEQIAINIQTYSQTKFFNFMLGLKKISQNTTKSSYSLIPMQDFSKPWTDKELYKKYNLSNDEIEYIETMIKPMK